MSVATDGTQANATSLRAAVSGNGQAVVFSSDASNLTANDTNGVTDVFVRDLVSHTTSIVSIATDGTPGTQPSGVTSISHADSLAISHDGNIVAFTSSASLVSDDTNQCSGKPCVDIYVRDRVAGTTTRVSVATDGTQANADSVRPSISADGRYVVFTSSATNLVNGDTNQMGDTFVHDRQTHTTTRVSLGPNNAQSFWLASRGVISADGRVVAFTAPDNTFDVGSTPPSVNAIFVRTLATGEIRRVYESLTRDLVLSADGTRVATQSYIRDPSTRLEIETGFRTVHNVTTGQRETLETWGTLGSPVRPGAYGIALNGAGNLVVSSDGDGQPDSRMRMHDYATGIDDPDMHGKWPSLSTDGRYLVFSSLQTDLVSGDTNGVADIFLLDRDPDGDGMPSTWELQFGLDPNNPADATADPDGDGLTNVQEYQANSHPKATQTRYFAEGAANDFFKTRIAVLNPNASAALVMLRFFGANGQKTSITRTIPALTRATFWTSRLDPVTLPDSTFSITVESDQPVVSDRLMTWGLGEYGSDLETSIAAPSTTWYFAEGASGSPYSLYYLLQNPGDVDAQATVTYLLPVPQAPITKTYGVPAHTRVTIDVTGEDPALKHAEVSAKITSTQPIVAERTMYMTTASQPFGAGHAGAAVAAPSTHWFLAEGATGFFDEYVLVANPESTAATLEVTYLLEGAQAFSETVDVDANSRYTIDVKSRDSRLLSTPVSVIVESTNGVPVVVERAMWWPHGKWYEASLSAGVTGTGTKWAIAEAEQGSVWQSFTYIQIANTDPAVDGTATVTLYPEEGAPLQITKTLPANSRTTVDVGRDFALSPTLGMRFGVIVESNGVPIVVERALYTSIGSTLWAAGGTSVATNITPVP